MGVVQLRQALQQRAADVTAGGGDGLCQRLVQTSDLMEGLIGAGLAPLSTLDAKKVSDGTVYWDICDLPHIRPWPFHVRVKAQGQATQ